MPPIAPPDKPWCAALDTCELFPEFGEPGLPLVDEPPIEEPEVPEIAGEAPFAETLGEEPAPDEPSDVLPD
jgi:hypothetical protein